MDINGHTYLFAPGYERLCSIIILLNLLLKFEASHICTGIYLRSEDEIRAPFEDPDSPVRRAGLKLVAIEQHDYNCGLYTEFMENVKEKGMHFVKCHKR